MLVANVHRQFGKSFLVCLIAVEFAMRRRAVQIRFVAPSAKELRKIVHPQMRTLLGDCPAELKPRWNGADGFYLFPNGSELHIAGVNDGHADDARGQRSHLNVIDEAGFVDQFDYVLKSVLLPQTLTTGGRTVVISTPPESPAHEFIPVLREAESRGAYHVHTLDQTTHLSPKAKAQLVTDMGGEKSTKVRRELFCEIVTDETRAVVPEWTDERAKASVRPVPAPTFETPLVSMDVGFEDFSHVLFGHYDFRRAKLCVRAEVRLQRMRTDELAAEIKRVESEIWPQVGTLLPAFGSNVPAPKPHRVSDTDLILINDMSQIHGLHFTPTEKDEKEAQVNQLRLWVQTGRIEIDPSCAHLIRQLHTAIWNKQRTEFERSAMDGHFDGVDALIYMLRNAPIHVNPYPALSAAVSEHTHTVLPSAADSANAAMLREAFSIRRRAHG